MYAFLTKRIEVAERLSSTARTVIFGTVSGLIWTVLGGGLLSEDLFGSSGEIATVFGAGVLTGILVSFLLRSALRNCGRLATLGYGILSLPFGAFAFGFLTSSIQFAVKAFTGIAYVGTVDSNPFEVGFLFAAVGSISICTIVYLPLAVLTTFLLRAVLLAGTHRN